MNTQVTIAETTEAARRMTGSAWHGWMRQRWHTPESVAWLAAIHQRNEQVAAALAQAMVDADLTPEQVEAIERTVGRFFE